MSAIGCIPLLLASGWANGADGTPVGLRGRLVDGAALVGAVPPRSFLQGGDDAFQAAERTPLRERKFKVHILDGSRRGEVLSGTSDAEGRFALGIDAALLPSSRCLVAEVEGSPALFSAAVLASKDAETEFRVYPVTQDKATLRTQIEIYLSIHDNPVTEKKDLEVKLQVVILNMGSDLYVGGLRADGAAPSREVFRVPVPFRASILQNRGPSGATWAEKVAESGARWLAIETPIPPIIEEKRGTFWELTYRVRAGQEMVQRYPISLDVSQFAVFMPAQDAAIEVESPDLPLRDDHTEGSPHTGGGPPQKVRYAVNLAAGKEIAVAIGINSAALGQINRGALLVVGSFFLVVVGAMLAGLILSRRAPESDLDVGQASGEELIARIAQLDLRRERGELTAAEHEKERARLVSFARYVVPELTSGEAGAAGGAGVAGGAAAAGGAGAGVPAGLPQVTPRVAELIQRLQALEAGGGLDAARIHERAVLLEELAKALGGLVTPQKPKPDGGGGRRA